MTIRLLVLAAALLWMLGCPQTDDDSGGPDGDDDAGDDDIDDDDDADDDDAGDDDACSQLCGSVVSPDPAVGRTSFAPPGCGGGTFTYSWGHLLVNDAGKSVPVAEDLDGDGVADIVVNPRMTSSAHAFRGRGDGTFDPPVVLPAGGIFAGGWGLDVGDFTNDGLLDVVAGDHASGAVAWRNDGNLSFTVTSSGLPSDTLQGAGVVDLDGDGNLDAIFGADQFSTGFAVRHGDGAGGWSDRGVTGLPGLGQGGGANNGWINAGDVDGDGDADVVGFGQSGNGAVVAQVYANGGNGVAFTHLGDLPGGNAGSIGSPVQGAVGDVDCDGAPDIAAGGSVWIASGGGWSPGATADGTWISQLGDLDGDGYLDLVTHDVDSGVHAYLNDGAGLAFTHAEMGLPDQDWVSPVIQAGQDLTPLAVAYGLDLVDVDGDGRLDLIRTFQAEEVSGWSTIDYTVLEVWTRP